MKVIFKEPILNVRLKLIKFKNNHPTYLDLTFHSDSKEHEEVHNQDWPKNWNVKYSEESTDHSDRYSFCTAVPKLELW